jgi:hypothetical protein
MLDGFARVIYDNQDYFEGEFKENKKTGFGKVFYSNGISYEGEWKENKKYG